MGALHILKKAETEPTFRISSCVSVASAIITASVIWLFFAASHNQSATIYKFIKRDTQISHSSCFLCPQIIIYVTNYQNISPFQIIYTNISASCKVINQLIN